MITVKTIRYYGYVIELQLTAAKQQPSIRLLLERVEYSKKLTLLSKYSVATLFFIDPFKHDYIFLGLHLSYCTSINLD